MTAFAFLFRSPRAAAARSRGDGAVDAGTGGAGAGPNDLMREYYTQRASAGLIISEATTISEQANGWVDSPGVYTDAQEAGWRKIVAALHAPGTPIFLQLWHLGRASHRPFHGGQPTVLASAIKINGEYIHTPIGQQPYEVPRALETADVAASEKGTRIDRRRPLRLCEVNV